MSSVIFVRKSDLPSTPKAFQQYVADFFMEKKILGVDCWYASTVLHVTGYDWNHLGPGRGIAPSHSVELQKYREGLPEGTSLNTWMEENREVVQRLHAHEEFYRGRSCC